MLLVGSLIDIKKNSKVFFEPKRSHLPSDRNRSCFGVMIRITSGKKEAQKIICEIREINFKEKESLGILLPYDSSSCFLKLMFLSLF